MVAAFENLPISLMYSVKDLFAYGPSVMIARPCLFNLKDMNFTLNMKLIYTFGILWHSTLHTISNYLVIIVLLCTEKANIHDQMS